MDYQTLITRQRAYTKRHRELQASMMSTIKAVSEKGGLNPKTLIKVITSGDLSALGISENFLKELDEYQLISEKLCEIVDKLTDSMEAQYAKSLQ